MASFRASFPELCHQLEESLVHPQPDVSLTTFTKNQLLDALGEFAHHLNGGTGRQVNQLALEVAFIRGLPNQIKNIIEAMDQEIRCHDDMRPIKQALLGLITMASRNGKR